MAELIKPFVATKNDFEPEITAFYCIYCGYMAADAAGVMQVQYPANVKLIKMPCTGKTDIQYILDAFEHGADGVYVVGCPIGNCHHVRGNERAQMRVDKAKALLDEVGIGGERLEMHFVSGGMGETFAQIAQEITDRVKTLGPSPLKQE